METQDLLDILKQETDRITIQIDSYRKGYLDALVAITTRIQSKIEPK